MLILALVLFALLILIGQRLYENRYLFADNAEPKSTPIFSYESGQNYRFLPYGKHFLAVGNEGVTEMTAGGRTVQQISFPASAPTVDISGSYFLIYDRGGNTLSSYKGKDCYVKQELPEEILLAKINSKGFLAVVTEERSYQCKVEIYNRYGESVYEWLVADYHIIDIAVAPDCKRFAAAVLDTSKGHADGALLFVDIEAEAVAAREEQTDSLFLSLCYGRGNTLMAVTETDVRGYNEKGERKWLQDFGGCKLLSFDMEENRNIVLSLEEGNNTARILSYTRDGKEAGSYHAATDTGIIASRGNTVAVGEAKEVALLRHSGTEKGRLPSPKEVKQIVLTDKNVLAVGGNAVYCLQ